MVSGVYWVKGMARITSAKASGLKASKTLPTPVAWSGMRAPMRL